MKVQISQLPHAADLPLPDYETPGAVGFDICTAEDREIAPGEIARIRTGLVFKTPPGYALIIAPRSSTPAKKKLDMPHSLGVIDQDYCGPTDELLLQVRNFSSAPVTVKRGEKIAQGLFVRVDRAEWQEITFDQLKAAESRGGFGSTSSLQ